jgi:hypothetical protein
MSHLPRGSPIGSDFFKRSIGLTAVSRHWGWQGLGWASDTSLGRVEGRFFVGLNRVTAWLRCQLRCSNRRRQAVFQGRLPGRAPFRQCRGQRRGRGL